MEKDFERDFVKAQLTILLDKKLITTKEFDDMLNKHALILANSNYGREFKTEIKSAVASQNQTRRNQISGRIAKSNLKIKVRLYGD